VQALTSLRTLLNDLPDRLKRTSAARVELRPDPSKWSPKEELGHLIDSAVNNHRRIVLIQLENSPALPSYDGERWVEVQRYHERDWNELVQLWSALNHHLLAAAEAVPESAWGRPCTIGDSEPVTLKFVVDDYVDHMMHHLRHIGIEVDDLIAA
jgi:DinB superfamily